MEDEQSSSEGSFLTKTQLAEHFNQMFQEETNNECFQCRVESRHWAEKNHAVFLCVNCAARYKDLSWAVEIKSITVDPWTKAQISKFERGGNGRFRSFLKHYQLDELGFKDKLKTKAAHHYRLIVPLYVNQLEKEQNGHETDHIPVEEGRQPYRLGTVITDLTVDEMLDSAKQEALWLGSKTKQYGGKALEKTKQLGGKAYDKIISGELAQDAKEVAHKVSASAQYLWDKLVTKIDQVAGERRSQELSEEQKNEDKLIAVVKQTKEEKQSSQKVEDMVAADKVTEIEKIQSSEKKKPTL